MDGDRQPAPRPGRLVTRVAINLIVPPVVYVLVRGHLTSDAAALAIVGAIPVAWTVAFFLRRRRVDPIGMFAVAGFCVAVIVSVATGGSALPLKLHTDFLLSGTLGLALLISAAVRRPLLPPILRVFGRGGTVIQRSPNTLTAAVGAILLAAAVTHVALALILPTETFLVVARIAALVVYAVGAWLLSRYARRLRARDAEG